jgi:hypothetical protein
MKYLILSLLISQSAFAIFPKSLNKKIFKNTPIKTAKGGGAMDGGGSGANFPESGAAWFYQDNPKGHISICIKREPTFKASYKETEGVIKTAFKKWGDYIDAAKIYEEITSDDEDDSSTWPYPQKLKILTKIKIDETCTEKTDVTFYFGLVDKKVQDVLDNMVSPKAFAYRNYKDIDAINGTSKGMVYIFSPKPIQQDDGSYDGTDMNTYNWSLPNRLLAMTLHEVGHIVGVPHISGTIMEDNFEWVFNRVHNHYNDPEEAKRYASYLTKINHDSHVHVSANIYKASGTLGIPGSQDEKDTYKFFTQKNLIGKSKIEFSTSLTKETFNITISDDSTTTNFKNMKFGSVTSTYAPANDHVFKRVRKTVYTSSPWGTKYNYDSDYEFSPKVLAHTTMQLRGKTFPVDVSINMGFSAYSETSTSYWIDSPMTMFFYSPITGKRTILLADRIRTYEMSDGESEDSTDFPELN